MRRDAIERVLSIDESGEVVAEGVVSHTGQGCELGSENCHFFLMVDEVPIAVYYVADTKWNYLPTPNGELCMNLEASARGSQVENGDRVRVFGKYFELGNISTCGDVDYYIERLP